MKHPLLVVFDIDETLIHFINKRDVIDVWDTLDEKAKLYFDYIEDAGHVIIFRPKLQILFNYLIENNISIGLWTYSDIEYAVAIKSLLIEHFKLNKNVFKFVYSVEEIETAFEMSLNSEFNDIDKKNESVTDVEKDLRYIWFNFPKKFNKFNTILVDDRDANLLHKINNKNCIYIQPFAPFSVHKKRQHLSKKSLDKSLNDNIVDNLILIIDKVKNDIYGVDLEEFKEAFNNEEVFTEKRVKRMGLDDFYINYKINKNNKKVKIISVGDVNKEKLSISSPSNYINTSKERSSPEKGGKKYTNKYKNELKKKYKLKTRKNFGFFRRLFTIKRL
jgi:hypothetical protein